MQILPLGPGRQVDQASGLRELAQPLLATAGHESAMARPTILGQRDDRHVVPHCDPRVVLISEYPVLQGGYRLAWQLAQQFSADGARVAIVDLAPAASRLPRELSCGRDAAALAAVAARQALWCESPHGRSLATWELNQRSAVDIIAQPAGRLPTAEQMPRICEQLIRAIGRSCRGIHATRDRWNTVILLSESQGVPLDLACWQAADEILLLLPSSSGIGESAESSMVARLATACPAQRRLALWKRHAAWTTPAQHWNARRISKWLGKGPPSLADCRGDQRLIGFEHRSVTWPPALDWTHSVRRRDERRLARLTRWLISELNRISLPTD